MARRADVVVPDHAARLWELSERLVGLRFAMR